VTPSAHSAAIGIVLAGGASSRMQPGAPSAGEQAAPVRKEWLDLGGRTLLDRVVDAVAAETSRTIIVTAPDRPLPPLSRSVDIVHDSRPGSGPLAALLDGLDAIDAIDQAAEEPLVFVCSCDVPGLKREVIRWLVDRATATGADWVVPEVANHPQVLTSVIRRSLRGPIAAWLAAGRRDLSGLVASLRHDGPTRIDLVEEQALAVVDPGLGSFFDIDTPEDLAAGRRACP